ncbi:MAG: hypothetical protein SFW36_17750 [Leptolyngbyaceae cyanobacterium bins.59]|nr:hypothetical protein [Leptolyngbyaceae cyanobacterium bins.59]
MQQDFGEFSRLEQGQYTMFLQRELSETSESAIYFTLPGQNDYLYEYEGDLDEALDDLPEIYEASEVRIGALTPQAVAVVEQLWDYFDRTGEQTLEGEQEYNFQVQGETLLIFPKDDPGEVVAIDRDGQVESNFQPERFEHLMERFAIAHQQIQQFETDQNHDRSWEL